VRSPVVRSPVSIVVGGSELGPESASRARKGGSDLDTESTNISFGTGRLAYGLVCGIGAAVVLILTRLRICRAV